MQHRNSKSPARLSPEDAVLRGWTEETDLYLDLGNPMTRMDALPAPEEEGGHAGEADR